VYPRALLRALDRQRARRLGMSRRRFLRVTSGRARTYRRRSTEYFQHEQIIQVKPHFRIGQGTFELVKAFRCRRGVARCETSGTRTVAAANRKPHLPYTVHTNRRLNINRLGVMYGGAGGLLVRLSILLRARTSEAYISGCARADIAGYIIKASGGLGSDAHNITSTSTGAVSGVSFLALNRLQKHRAALSRPSRTDRRR